MASVLNSISQSERDRIITLYDSAIKGKSAAEKVETLNSEYTAHFTEKALKSKAFLNALLKEDATVKDKIISFFKQRFGDEKLDRTARKLAKAYEKAFNEMAEANFGANSASASVSPQRQYSISTVNITQKDVQTLRSIGRKSINAFTSEDIKKSEPWARKFYSELDTRSPFFRAWFGDWRAWDKTSVSYVELTDERIETKDISKDGATNRDTGWDILVNGKSINETANKNGKWSPAYHSLRNINAMLQNAVLLDSFVVTEPSSKMDKTATFMHHLYCPVKIGANIGIAKLYVTENIGDEHKFYLTKIEMESNDSSNQSKNSGRNSSLDSTISVAQIFEFVNRNNAEFEANSENPTDFSPKPVNPLLLNEDGTPKMLYHQTASVFWTFSTENPVAGKNDSETPNGIFLKENDHDIGIGGNRQMALYARIEKPLHFANREEARAWYVKNIPDYAALQKEFDKAIEQFNQTSTELENEWFEANKLDDEEALQKIEEREDKLLDDFKPVEEDYGRRLRDILNSYFIDGNSGYDGIILDYDGHRWVNGKREDVKTYIVFKNTQIKSATDNIGTFDLENPDVRYSISESEEQPSTVGGTQSSVLSSRTTVPQQSIDARLKKQANRFEIDFVNEFAGIEAFLKANGADANEVEAAVQSARGAYARGQSQIQ